MKKWVAVCLTLFLAGLGPVLSYALTPEQVLQLKKAGVEEKTIQLMIEQEIAAGASDPYEKMGTREIKDQDGNTIVIYSTGHPSGGNPNQEEQEKVDRAWEMLRNIIIDAR
ncbi:MAG: hypothetical protein JW902_03160 [Syntrophaceae bacterium]|nr:hypothetical protein [Syntrophaceae bacterium]